jgi:hypothetical protein
MTNKKNKTHVSTLQLRLKRQILPLLCNKKAASVVVSTLILTAGVVAMSIAVLYWTYGMGKISHIEYTKSTTSNMNAVNERVGFEYVTGSGNRLDLNIINWGKSDNITITHVLVFDSIYSVVGANTGNITLYNIGTTSKVTGNHLRIGGDAYLGSDILSADRTTIISSLTYISLTPTNPGITLSAGLVYYARVVTASGRTYDGSFVAT